MIYKKYVWQFASNMPLPLIKIETSSKRSLEKTQYVFLSYAQLFSFTKQKCHHS